MKRFKHSLSHYKLLSCDMGELVPITCFEVLPGDSIQQATSLLIRVSPLLAPVMHPVQVRVHHWFVPNRLVWDDWEKFITGQVSGAYPTRSGAIVEGNVNDYLGVHLAAASGNFSILPLRAYNLIFNEYYRDEDLMAERVVSTLSGVDTLTTGGMLPKVAWEKDYFTTARPWPQKGGTVSLPLGTSAEVKLSPTAVTPWFRRTAGQTVIGGAVTGESSVGDLQVAGIDSVIDPRGSLFADLSTATAANVNDVRRAFALQRYQEARAQYGHRYTEYLRYLGVRSSDARLQRPEYLGGGKQTISFTEVLQTSPSADAGLDGEVGNLKGHGIAAMRSRRYRRFFEEHGHVISLMSVRPKTMYGNGLPRMFNRLTKEDYWQKELELIGQQSVLNKEVYGPHSVPDGVFGYQDRYAEYRHIMSSLAGEFRTTLNYWHMARIFAADPVLNEAFVTSDPTKRIHAVQSNDVLWIMANHSVQARRMVGRGGKMGRII